VARRRKAPGPPLSTSEIMARIRSRNTRPELATRSALHGLGYRFRVNVKDLPGTPDIAIKSKRLAIFVHGCFWHLHEGCRLSRPPTRNTSYWGPKLRRNAERDARMLAELASKGFRVLVVWECETADRALLEKKLAAFMRADRS
jgi:DNA mismatch endonuclease, patch repair protein